MASSTTASWLRSEKQRVDALDLNTYKMLCDKQQQQRLHDEEEQRLHDEKKQL
ncbi:5410_t:CDS:2, partial [Dentiscutata erythropus]